jgi:hypothetical protein
MIASPPHNTSDQFFATQPKVTDETHALDASIYVPAPDDWYLIATDVKNSTGAVASGQHKTVNFVAAASIAALKNACAPIPIPFLFGGDGATIMVPASFGNQARLILARLRGLIQRQFGLDLVVGCLQVSDIRANGQDVRVGRYEPTPGNHFGVFTGGGVSLLEKSIKGRGNETLQRLSDIPITLDDGGDVDLSGLSCRWDQLKSTRGKMLSVIVLGDDDTLRQVYGDIQRLAANGGDPRPVSAENLRLKWPPPGHRLEARARHKRGPLWFTTARLLAETAVAHVIITNGLTIGKFDANRYKSEIITNTDFCRYDDGLFFVIDCATAAIPVIANYLAAKKGDGTIRFGIHASETALMTCFVTSTDESLHVHFVDGANGGYTRAAELLKGRVTLEQALAGL